MIYIYSEDTNLKNDVDCGLRKLGGIYSDNNFDISVCLTIIAKKAVFKNDAHA